MLKFKRYFHCCNAYPVWCTRSQLLLCKQASDSSVQRLMETFHQSLEPDKADESLMNPSSRREIINPRPWQLSACPCRWLSLFFSSHPLHPPPLADQVVSLDLWSNRPSSIQSQRDIKTESLGCRKGFSNSVLDFVENRFLVTEHWCWVKFRLIVKKRYCNFIVRPFENKLYRLCSVKFKLSILY